MEQTHTQSSGFRKWGGLIILSLALAIIILDTTILNVSIATLIKDLKTDIQSIQWVITIYSLTVAALTITGGRLGDLFGKKNMFIAGAVIFAIGSFIASISTNITGLMLGWSIIEGIGAALMMPATASLLITNFHGRDRAIAFGVWGGIAAAAAAIGPILGGFLTENVSWHWAFRINVVVVLALLAGSFLVKEVKGDRLKKRLDIVGVFLSAIGLSALVYGIIESSTYGWLKAKTAFELAGKTYDLAGLSISFYAIIFAIITLSIFIYWELRTEKKGNLPLVSMKLFRNKQFTSGLLTTAAVSLGQSGLIFSIPIFLQTVRGYDSFKTGLALLPMSLTLLIAAPASAYFSKTYTPKRLIQLGLVINFISVFVLAGSLSTSATTLSLAPGLILYGLGLGLVMAQISNLTLSAVKLHEAGEASGVNNTFRQVGSTLGSAIIGAIFLSTLTSNLTNGVKESEVIPESAKTEIVEKVSTSTSELEFGGSISSENSEMPGSISNEIKEIVKNSSVGANKSALLFSSSFVILTLLASIYLPNTKKLEKGSGENVNLASH